MSDSEEDSDEDQEAAPVGSKALRQRLRCATLQNAGAVLDVNVHRLDVEISFEAEEGTSSSSSGGRGPKSTKSACIPACLEESFCRQAAGDLASDVGRSLDVVEQELLALELREVATLRGWADAFVPLLNGGHRGFLLDSSTSLPEDVNLPEFRLRLEESLAKAEAGTWSFGGKLARSLHVAALQRAELEEMSAQLEEEVVTMAPPDRKVRVSLPALMRGPVLSNVRYLESRAAWWVDAADGLLQLLERKGVQGGQVIAIDAHTGYPDQEATFSAHYSLQLPGSGSMNIRYKRCEVDGKEAASNGGFSPDAGAEFSWEGLYDWANREMRNRRVVSITASCSRKGGGVLTCFYEKEANQLDDVEVVEEQSTYWILAARELVRALTNAGVRAGQVLWIDAHSNPGSNQVVFAAHYSRSLPDRGELHLRYEANEGKKAFKEATEVHHWAAARVMELRLSREDLVSLTYTADLHGRLTCFIFYQDAAAADTPTASAGPPSLPMLPSVPSLRPLPELPKEPPVKVTARKIMNASVGDAWRFRRPTASAGAAPVAALPDKSRPSLSQRRRSMQPDEAGVPAEDVAEVADEPQAPPEPEPEYFEMMPKKVVFLGGHEQESMPADDLEACKAFCRKQRCGAFVVTNKMAYFRTEPPETCAEHLVDDPRSTTFIRRGPATPSIWSTKLHLMTSFSRADKSANSVSTGDSPVQTAEVSGAVRHEACAPQCALQ